MDSSKKPVNFHGMLRKAGEELLVPGFSFVDTDLHEGWFRGRLAALGAALMHLAVAKGVLILAGSQCL